MVLARKVIVWRTPLGRSGNKDNAVDRGARSHCGHEGCNTAVRMGYKIDGGVLANS